MPSAQKLSIVIPTRKPWPSPRLAVSAALAAAAEVGGEVILATGHPDGAPDEPIPGVRVVLAPSADVFSARSAALSGATGDIVAILEDHCYPPPGWATKLMAVWEAHPEAAGVVGTMDNGAPALIDSASFLLTWAPFIGPIDQVPADRCPAPGVVSYRKDELVAPDTEAAGDGWLEYDLPVRLREEGRLVAATSVRMTHIQQVGRHAFMLHYWSGRSFTGPRRDTPGIPPRAGATGGVDPSEVDTTDARRVAQQPRVEPEGHQADDGSARMPGVVQRHRPGRRRAHRQPGRRILQARVRARRRTRRAEREVGRCSTHIAIARPASAT